LAFWYRLELLRVLIIILALLIILLEALEELVLMGQRLKILKMELEEVRRSLVSVGHLNIMKLLN